MTRKQAYANLMGYIWQAAVFREARKYRAFEDCGLGWPTKWRERA